MPEFGNKEEYEKWKAERREELLKTWICPECSASNAISEFKCTCGYTADETFPKEQEEISESNPNLINCPTCKNEISINATACPKCGEPITDKIRQEETERFRREGLNSRISPSNSFGVAAIACAVVSLFWLSFLLAPIAIILGVVAMSRNEKYGGVAIIIGIIGVIIVLSAFHSCQDEISSLRWR